MTNNHIFAHTGSFEELYPEVDSIKLEIQEFPIPGWKTAEKTYSMTNKTRISSYIRCTNPLCHKGGFSISTILAQAISRKDTKISADGECGSNEISGRPCLHYFEVEGEITYKA